MPSPRKRSTRTRLSEETSHQQEGPAPDAKRRQVVEEEEQPRVVMVTPGTNHGPKVLHDNEAKRNVRRALFSPGGTAAAAAAPVTPSSSSSSTKESPAKRKLVFGRLVEELEVQDNVREVYAIIRKLTGSIGGNASSGPIYGELTMGSMQRMINLMKKHTDFDHTSRFIDVGSGIGKPNLHVTQDPGVEFSYGIEVEFDRWLLGMNCLKGVLDAAQKQENTMKEISEGAKILHRCIFEHADIRKAETFDPFTHVYMFSIGFPPMLWVELATMWNRSHSPYLICYHSPRDIIHNYEFDVELVAQMNTSMHGSKESHMGYIYRRSGVLEWSNVCDPVFKDTWNRMKNGRESLREEVDSQLVSCMKSGPSARTRRRRLQAKK